MITGNFLQRLAIVAAMALSGLSMQAMAQQDSESAEQEEDAAQEPEERRGPQLDQIIVTARKTEESLQDVPLAITAFSAQEIEDAGINSFQDVADFTPGLTFSNLYGQQVPVPVIRGVSPVSVFDENAAAVFVDGIYVSAREGLDVNQLDLERIEVVKGPQAAMYGRNSFSGAVNFITAKPTDEFQGSAEVQFGTREKALGKFTISGPIIPGLLRGRFSMAHDEWAGSYNNQIPDGPNIGGYEKNAWVGGLDFLPTDSLEARVTVYVSNDHFDAPAMASIPVDCERRGDADPDETSTPNKLQDICGRIPDVKKNDLAALPEETGEDTDTVRANVEVAWDTGIGTFDLLAGTSATENSGVLTAAPGTSVWDSAYQGTNAVGPDTIKLVSDFQIYQFTGLQQTTDTSVEIRYSTPIENRFVGSVGVYGFQTEGKSHSSGGLVLKGNLPDDFVSFCPCFEGSDVGDPGFGFFGVGDAVYIDSGWLTPPEPSEFGNLLSVSETDSIAFFGAFDADISDTLEARLEARFTEEEKTFTEKGPNADPQLSDTWRFTTWRATLKWAPTEDFMVYTGVAKAEKSGDFFTVTIDNVITKFVLDSESLIAYELGSKFSLLDNRIQVDVAAFFQDWTDMVVPFTIEPPQGQPIGGRQNAGDAEIFGIETSVDVAFTDYMTVRFAGSWTDATLLEGKIRTFEQFVAFAPDGDIAGQKIHRQSEWTGNATGTYRRPFMSTQYEWYLRADALYTGKQFMTLANTGIIPPRTIVNLRSGFDSDKYQLEFWVRNLFNEAAPTSAHRNVLFQNVINGSTDFFSTFFPFVAFHTGGNLRTYGVTGRIRF